MNTYFVDRISVPCNKFELALSKSKSKLFFMKHPLQHKSCSNNAATLQRYCSDIAANSVLYGADRQIPLPIARSLHETCTTRRGNQDRRNCITLSRFRGTFRGTSVKLIYGNFYSAPHGRTVLSLYTVSDECHL